MVVASGQYPYEYDVPLPIRGPIGQSGNILEAGLFVINAELRKWGREPLNNFTYNKYSHPDIAGSGFEPKINGVTLGGDVAGPAIVALDNILEARQPLRISTQGLWDVYGDDAAAGGSFARLLLAESWFTTAYPGHASGFIVSVDLGFGYSLQRGTYLRPELEDFSGGDDHVDTDLHWLGGSGIIFDIDIGEVVFQPFPFFGTFGNFAAGGTGNQKFNFGPLYPLFQTTNGSLISMTGREVQAADVGAWRLHTNFDAIASGKVQIDGYAFIPETRIHLITGNVSNYFSSYNPTSDFTFFIGGLRQVNRPNGINDRTARTYWTPQAQPTGFYSTIPRTPKDEVPLMGIESGIFGIFPPIDYRPGLTNRELGGTLSISSDGALIKTPADGGSQGYQVFDDCLWTTTRGSLLSGVTNSPSRGILPISPHNGAHMWYRPADQTIATAANKPTLSSEYNIGISAGTPGNFEVHVGLESIGTDDIIRISRVWSETITPVGGPSDPDQYDNIVYFQRYSGPTMNHSETSVGWTHTGAAGTSDTGQVDNAISDLFFDGTSYWIVGRFLSRMVRFTSALAFNGHYVASGPGGGVRRAYVNSEYIYWTRKDGLTAGDPLLTDANMSNYSQGSGIGKWSIASTPANINIDVGTFTHDSAKPIIAETIVGHRSSIDTVIHDIVYIDSLDATHITSGIWVLIQFDNELWLLRVSEQSTYYKVEEAIDLNVTVSTGTPVGDDYPYEIIHRDID